MPESGKEKYPEKETPEFMGLLTGPINGVWRLMRWSAKKIQDLAEKMSDGPLAFVTLPLSLPVREGARTVIKLTPDKLNINKVEHFMGHFMAGSMGFMAGSIGSIIATADTGLTLANTALVISSGAIGLYTGFTVLPIIFPLTAGLLSGLSAIPRAIINIPTGFQRSYHALTGGNKKQPKIINPVPDRGVVPTALPAPSALIKLVDAKTEFEQSAGKQQQSTSTAQPPTGKPPAIS